MGLMSESVPVRCPACRREHVYAAPSYPLCVRSPRRPAAGSSRRGDGRDPPGVGRGLGRGALRGLRAARRVAVPGVGLPLRDPAADSRRGRGADLGAGRADHAARRRCAGAARLPAGDDPYRATTSVAAAALYLRWLGYRDIRRADQRPPSGIGLAARGILAQVDPTVRPASLRDVECLWLTAMTESAECVYFSLAGYADDARAHADTLGVPLFVLDLTGTPQPVNDLADQLDAAGS